MSEEEAFDVIRRGARSWLFHPGRDGPPRLWFTHRQGSLLRWRPSEIHDEVWRVGRIPREVLRTYAKILTTPNGRGLIADVIDPVTFVGVLFVSDGWMLEHEDASPAGLAKADQLHAFAKDRGVSAHPDRVEVVSAYHVSRDGHQAMGVFNLDGTERRMLGSGPDLRTMGAIPDALAAILTSINSAIGDKG